MAPPQAQRLRLSAPLTHSRALQFYAVPKSISEVVQSATLPFSELRIV